MARKSAAAILRAALEAEILAERAEQVRAVIPSTAAEHAAAMDAALDKLAKVLA